MSNAKTPAKVLRVALRRIQTRWTKGHWVKRDRQTGVTEICIEGAIYGFKDNTNNPACKLAVDIVQQILDEKYGEKFSSIPAFNDDPATTQEMAEEVVKLALIRAETGGLLRENEEDCYEDFTQALRKGQWK